MLLKVRFYSVIQNTKMLSRKAIVVTLLHRLSEKLLH